MSAKSMNGDTPRQQLPEGLPAELKTVEAALAALRPRADRLDRERIMFLAGQTSMTGLKSHSTWGWPTAFAGMSAVAATLLVVVLSGFHRPNQPAIMPLARLVDMATPIKQPRERNTDQPVDRERALVAEERMRNMGLANGSAGAVSAYHSRTVYVDVCSWMISQGLDPWTPPVDRLETTVAGGHDEPLTYQQWRATMLGNQETQI